MNNPFPSSKKGQGISMETIVIAVIVVSVLVILLLVFTGRINWFGGQLKVCAASGGVCANDCSNYQGSSGKEQRQTLFKIDTSKPDNMAKQCGTTTGNYCCSGVGIPLDTT